MKRPNELNEGEKAIIIMWVNQPDYVGCHIRKENGKLIRTNKNGIDCEYVDMRYPHYCKVNLI